MKKMLFAASVAAICGLSSCGQQADVAPAQGSRTGFALSFFRNVNKTVPSSENVFVSPYSAGVALSMFTEGVEGQTKVELDNALNGCLFMKEQLSEGDTVVVKSANSVWVDSDFSIRNHYVSLLQKDYDAAVENLSFADPATVPAINGWCADNTNGKITEILDKLSPDMVMVLINALYFNAPWQDQFDSSLTAEQPFYGQAGEQRVQMMARKGYYNYAEYQGCQIIQLPYEGGRYSMYVILPPSGVDINSVLPYVNESVYDAAMKMLAPQEVRFKMPKVRLETELLLNNTLKNMGVQTAFTSAADFRGIAATGPLAVDQVKQKCYIDVTETGTEAAAVTSIQMRLTSVRPEMNVKTMTVDRPYLFVIADKDNILFAGKIVNFK